MHLRSQETFDSPYPEISISSDSTLIARGKYLLMVRHCACATCKRFKRVEAGEIVPLWRNIFMLL
jgi:hypothetical protein